VTEQQALQALKSYLADCKQQDPPKHAQQVAREIGIGRSYLCDVLAGRRTVSERIRRYLGLEDDQSASGTPDAVLLGGLRRRVTMARNRYGEDGVYVVAIKMQVKPQHILEVISGTKPMSAKLRERLERWKTWKPAK
jgi:hypothetical protein